MEIMSTKQEWLYRLIIDNVRLKPRQNGEYLIDMLLTGIPKDKYDSDLVLKAIGDIQNVAAGILEKLNLDILSDFKELQNTLQKKLKEHYFGK